LVTIEIIVTKGKPGLILTFPKRVRHSPDFIIFQFGFLSCFSERAGCGPAMAAVDVSRLKIVPYSHNNRSEFDYRCRENFVRLAPCGFPVEGPA